MAAELYIPKLGQTVEEVTLVRWRVKNGEKVEHGQEVLEVETDKAVFDVEATADGFIHLGPYQDGDLVPVLTVVALIGKEDEEFSTVEPSAQSEEAPKSTESQSKTEDKIAMPIRSDSGDKVFASPRSRQLAAANGVNLSEVEPTGGNGVRITEADVLRYLAKAADTTPVAERLPLRGVRAATAAHMAASARETARVTLFSEADATELVHLREGLKTNVSEAWGFTPGYNDLFAVICARLLRKYAYMNARLSRDAIEILKPINIGIAVDDERGLFVPVIHGTDEKDLQALGKELRRLVAAVRDSSINPDDLSGGTFTITNLGSYGVDGFTPVINLPEAAILGIGRISPKPVVREGKIAIRSMLTLSLAFDHRLVDGAPAAEFLQAVREAVEKPDIYFENLL